MIGDREDSFPDPNHYELANTRKSLNLNLDSNGPIIGCLAQEGHFCGPLSPPSCPKKVRGAEIALSLRRGINYRSLLDLLPNSPSVALYDMESLPSFAEPSLDNRIKTDRKQGGYHGLGSDGERKDESHFSEMSLPKANKQPLSYLRLKKFVNEEFDLTVFGLQPNFNSSVSVKKINNRISVMLPNGPELAVLMIAMLSRGYCCAPLNPTATSEEIYGELQSTQSRAIIILSGASISANNAAMQAAERAQIGMIALSSIESVTGLFRMALLRPVSMQDATFVQTEVQQEQVNNDSGLGLSPHPEIVLLLHTSGTSGNKKLVPYSLEALVVGVACIISSWRLDCNDVCLNMMPLFHIGGIVRNILSPLLAGGAVISCAGFDALLFWDILYRTDELVTWYYAAPTMHHAILHECANRSNPRPVSSVRFIANAAGGLLPSLASALKTTFYNAVILTSYGMTECMPISSPPQNYALEPVGTSGVSVGPDVIIVDDMLKVVQPGSGGKGNILIRGPPCFGGYLNNSSANDESFVEVEGVGKGWFNTGDVGSLDSNGYLFISGRSKEIINRGGETISPLEVEEALQQHANIKEALVFSAPHTHFQETVAAIVVMKSGKQRVDLPSLHRYLDSKLHRSKWPQLLVFSDALPKNAAGKLLRIKLGERLSLDDLCADEQLAPLERLYEAACPPIGTPLSVPIVVGAFQARKVRLELTLLIEILQRFSQGTAVRVVTVDLPAAPKAIVALVPDEDTKESVESRKKKAQELKDHCIAALPGYLVPENIFFIGNRNPSNLDDKALVFQLIEDHETVRPRSRVERQLELIWRSQLRTNTSSSAPISITSSFFDLGGDSLKAGQLVNAIRKELRVQLSVADLFVAPSIEKMAQKISKQKTLGSVSPSPALFARDRFSTPTVSPEIYPGYGATVDDSNKDGIAGKRFDSDIAAANRRKKQADQSALGRRSLFSWDYAPPLSSTSTGCLFIQLLPLSVIYPIRRILIWFLIAGPWVLLMKAGWGRFNALLAAMLIARIALGLWMPLFGILVKWLVIGRYRAGRYPLWGSMYLKWWIVEQTINIMGKGYFRDDIPIIGTYMVRLYYTLMGARIGKRAQIHRLANLGQADLLTLGDDVALDNCTVRPFALDEGHFVLLPIIIEDRCSVGVKSIVAPGSILKAGTCIGPQSSSHESEEDADPAFRNYCRPTFQPPPTSLIILVGLPIMILLTAVQFIPWFCILKLMVSDAKAGGWYKADIHNIYDAFLWWITPKRLLYFFLLRVVKRCVQPFIRLAAVILAKWTIIGRFGEMDQEKKKEPWQRFRYWLMSKLLPGGGLLGVAKLVGTHYEVISIIYRLLGAKIGKRVYWPGSGVEIVEFDLFEVGDDVVFGSRSVVLTSSALVSKTVRLQDGCMVADRCVLLPGTRLEKGSVLGSGSLAAEDFVAEAGSVWVGSSGGRAVNVSPADYSYNVKETITPFGRAFYDGKAAYGVIPLWAIVLYSSVWQAFCTCYRNCSTALSLMACKQLLWLDPFSYRSPLELFQLTLLAFIPLNVAMATMALTVDVLGKWFILGRRTPGIYPWDESSYCQRWQCYLTLQEIRRGERHGTGLLDMIQGSQYLVWYFQALGCKIGSNVCLYPNGGNPMMTEPDLVVIGDFCCIDDASLIGHINTRGIFRLNPLVVGSGCVLKSNARLLSGATMQSHSMLMEHTLVMAGESVDLGSVWQGWPTRKQVGLVRYRAEIKALLDAVALQYTTELSSSVAMDGEADGEVGEIAQQSASLTERTSLLSAASRERKFSYS